MTLRHHISLPMPIRASHITASLLFACAAGTHAAELGEAKMQSHIGQQLVADVELTMIEDAGTPVGVRLAHPDVYRGANIAMPAVLSGLHLNVMRQGGRQFLHLSTLKPVESRHLHVYLELVDGGQRTVRLVTLWLTPDPSPAPPPVAAPTPAVAAPLPAPVQAASRRSVPVARPQAALHEGEEYVDGSASAAPVRKPVAKAMAPVKAAPARKPAPIAAPAKAPEAPAACTPQPADAQLNACTALGEKNAALHDQLGRLEAKMKGLQVAAGATPSPTPAAAAHAAAAPAAPPAPKGAPRILKAKKAPPPPEPETPWGLIGGALAAGLALAGLAVALLRRRKRSSFGKIPKEHKPARLHRMAKASEPDAPEGVPKPGFMASVKERLMPGNRKQAAPEAVEPALENADS
ncbi:FimV/HubP-related protein [Massilia sp. SYSU DXS3249]